MYTPSYGYREGFDANRLLYFKNIQSMLSAFNIQFRQYVQLFDSADADIRRVAAVLVCHRAIVSMVLISSIGAFID